MGRDDARLLMTQILNVAVLAGLIVLVLLVGMGIYIKVVGTRRREHKEPDGNTGSVPRAPDGP